MSKTTKVQERQGTQSMILRVFAQVVSYVFHPVFMPTLVAVMLFILAPTSFIGFTPEVIQMRIVQIIVLTAFFPLIFIGLLKALGFIQSIHMHDAKDRIIPLMGIMVFYFWAYHVFKNIDTPFILRVLLLGCFWGVIVLFLVNIFFKASMHTTAAGGVLGLVFVLTMISPVSMAVPLFMTIIVAGLIGTARLLIGTHRPAEIWTGYALGIIIQLAAFWYLN